MKCGNWTTAQLRLLQGLSVFYFQTLVCVFQVQVQRYAFLLDVRMNGAEWSHLKHTMIYRCLFAINRRDNVVSRIFFMCVFSFNWVGNQVEAIQHWSVSLLQLLIFLLLDHLSVTRRSRSPHTASSWATQVQWKKTIPPTVAEISHSGPKKG